MAVDDDNIQRLHRRLLSSSDEDFEAFRQDPGPLLEEHGVSFEPDEMDRLRQHLTSTDAPTLRNQIQTEGLRSMV